MERKVKIMKLKQRIDILKVHTGMKSGKEKTVKKWKGGELVFQLWLLTTSQLIALIEPRCQELLHHWKIPINRTNIEILQTSISSPILDLEKWKQQYLCIVYFLHGEAGDENKSKAEKNKVVSIMAPHRMGDISPEQATYSGAYKITLKNFSEIFHINMDQNTTHKGRRAITKYKHCHGQSNLHKNLWTNVNRSNVAW